MIFVILAYSTKNVDQWRVIFTKLGGNMVSIYAILFKLCRKVFLRIKWFSVKYEINWYISWF